MTLLYILLINLLYLLTWLIAPFNPKARLWISGRMGWRKKLIRPFPGKPLYWFHAASLGEFEQGRPLMEALKRKQPQCALVLTFYSPSGYEIRKHYPVADLVCYLPLDTPGNAKKFIRSLRPDAAFFIKYEYWYFYLRALKRGRVPVYVVSALFRFNQPFFRWYGGWFRKKLHFISHFFVQDQTSAELLGTIGLSNATVSGDTRFDRVAEIARTAQQIPLAEAFAAGSYCLVAGSTWPPDEELLIRCINETDQPVKFIIAPHEVQTHRISSLASRLRKKFVLYSRAGDKNLSDYQVLIIDNIGMLSSLYKYGKIAYIGGGFGAGIHNILEPAANGLPVIFGPNYGKFREASCLIREGGAYVIRNYDELSQRVYSLQHDSIKYNASSSVVSRYIHDNTGATEIILNKTVMPGSA